MANTLFYGDNLEVMRRHGKDESVDLVYLDPPFKSNQDYNVLFAEHDGTQAAAQIRAFEDTWTWDTVAAVAYQEVVEAGGSVSQVLQAFRVFLGESDMLAYLAMMAPRLIELHRVLKETGSIYLHCDPTASHYLKLLMDAVFSPQNFRNEIVWRYKKYQKAEMRYFTRNSDRILFYVKTPMADELFSPQFIQLDTPKKFLKRVWDKETGRIVNAKDKDGHVQYMEVTKEKIDDVWTLTYLMPAAHERLGYPTQKPEAVLDRIIQASSRDGDTVLDPFCGCGTTIAAAHRLHRKWIGIDITHLAITLLKHRLQDTFGGNIAKEYRVIGEPVTLHDAETLACDKDRYQFQYWALGLVGARPAIDKQKKGADRGIDGQLYFHDDKKGGKTEKVILSVKSGDIKSGDVRDLRGTVERTGAAIGVLITMQKPTKPMRTEAASAGFYQSPWGKKNHPKLQILTIEELLDGKVIDMPPIRETSTTFKRAKKTGKASKLRQPNLLDDESE